LSEDWIILQPELHNRFFDLPSRGYVVAGLFACQCVVVCGVRLDQRIFSVVQCREVGSVIVLDGPEFQSLIVGQVHVEGDDLLFHRAHVFAEKIQPLVGHGGRVGSRRWPRWGRLTEHRCAGYRGQNNIASIGTTGLFILVLTNVDQSAQRIVGFDVSRERTRRPESAMARCPGYPGD
jgi:hypothetical protein